MSAKNIIGALTLLCVASLSTTAHAWFFIVPIPNFSKPAPLNILIGALEKSEETKALAYVSEDKTFGSKYWVWGHYSGHVTQAEADRLALSRCQTSLANAKSQKAGGKELYDYGTKVCELYSFANKTVSPLATEQQRSPTVPATPLAPPALPASATAPPEQGTPVVPPAPATEQPTTTPVPPAFLPTTSIQHQPVPVQATPAPYFPTPQVAPPAVPPASQAQSPATKPQSAEGPTAQKLRELNDLRKEGLITEREYNEKRRAILSEM